MNKNIKYALILIFIIISGFTYYSVSHRSYKQQVYVSDVIDGDSFVLRDFDNLNVRLKGINAPEKNMFMYDNARKFLRDKIQDKQVEIEWTGTDQYGRILAYVYDDNNINKEILRKGLAHLYYYGKDDKFQDMEKAEQYARESKTGIWERSDKYGCLEIIELKFKESERCNNEERLIIKNKCNNDLDVILKDDSSAHIYDINIMGNSIWQRNFSCILNNAGDSVYIWDETGLLMFKRYD